jgi:hypothetical protein
MTRPMANPSSAHRTWEKYHKSGRNAEGLFRNEGLVHLPVGNARVGDLGSATPGSASTSRWVALFTLLR